MCFTALKAVLKCTCRSRPRARGDQGSLLQGNTLKSFCPHLHLSSKLIKSLQQHSEQLLPQPRPQHSLLQLGHLDCHSLSREVPSCPAPSGSRDSSAHQVHPGCPLLSEAINTSFLLFSPARAAGAGSVAAASQGSWTGSPHTTEMGLRRLWAPLIPTQLSSPVSAAAANAALSSQHLLEQAQAQLTQGCVITVIIFIPVRTISHFPVTLSHLPGFILSLSMSAWLSCSIFTSSPAAPPANFLPVHVLALQDDQPYANRSGPEFSALPLSISLS